MSASLRGFALNGKPVAIASELSEIQPLSHRLMGEGRVRARQSGRNLFHSNLLSHRLMGEGRVRARQSGRNLFHSNLLSHRLMGEGRVRAA
ncbi:hypothetical protein [Dehalogenimonas sp. 4OHTPN]|uniref:Uncharacterized protein n=1 Tax=Dehalogenimonas sp. 4OHTPN TaxID=3166643 RepID=A0AAU8GC11_9CHLR